MFLRVPDRDGIYPPGDVRDALDVSPMVGERVFKASCPKDFPYSPRNATVPRAARQRLDQLLKPECARYALLLDTYIKDRKERDRLFNAFKNIPCVKSKGGWFVVGGPPGIRP